MSEFNTQLLQKLYVPSPESHKGQNGKLLLIGGSRLFHAASLWPLTVASRMLDMVLYCSVPENNELVLRAKEEFRNGIIVPREKIDSYIEQADCILIGPGLPREDGQQEGDDNTKELTEHLLVSYPNKKWVIDGGSLQTIDASILLQLQTMPIVTPHVGEFEKLFGSRATNEASVQKEAEKYHAVVLLKGQVDIVSSPTESISISGGNAGMTKGGTGDVLAGLTASLYCKNDDPFLVACAASYINKKAGEELSKRMGIYFNASDLALEIPKVLSTL